MRVCRPLLAVCLLAGCVSHVELPVISTEYARGVTEEAWGPDFESGRYDVSRELSKDERAEIEAAVPAGSGRGHVGPRSSGHDVPADTVVSEVTRLHGGCSVAIGTARPRSQQGPGTAARYIIITRDSLGGLTYARIDASSPEDALTRFEKRPGAPVQE